MEVGFEENAQVRFSAEILKQLREQYIFREVDSKQNATTSKGKILLLQEACKKCFHEEIRKTYRPEEEKERFVKPPHDPGPRSEKRA